MIVYAWDPGTDPAFEPTMAVNDNLPSFSDTDSNGVVRTQNDPNSGDVYVSFAVQRCSTSGQPAGREFQPLPGPAVFIDRRGPDVLDRRSS